MLSKSTSSPHMERAVSIIQQGYGKPQNRADRQKRAIDLAAAMLEEANRIQTSADLAQQKQLSRMMRDAQGKAFTTAMTDQCFRSQHPARIANQLTHLLNQFGIPAYLDPVKRLELKAFQWMGNALSTMAVPLAKEALRKQTATVILPGESASLSKHMTERRKAGVRLNLNHLGEAILGEGEAQRRLAVYLDDLANPEIEYVSIKISTIFSQIHPIAWEHNLLVLKQRLRQLYRASMEHTFQRADGTQVRKFVNLDMEEYKDLHLTKVLFQEVLDEPEFYSLSAGIVLQAYLPDAFPLQQDLTHWASKRVSKGGAPIKIRIVKGANLAMEQIEASQRGWAQAPYKRKTDVDANFKRMLEYGLRKEHTEGVHIGVGSHNLFDIAYAILLCAESEISNQVTFEMLEGMADPVRRVVQAITGSILLYCPVATKEDFQSAIAYLIRRLDENTGLENFLRHAFHLSPGTTAWNQQAERFRLSCERIDEAEMGPRRTQNRLLPKANILSEFTNEADTDFSLPANRQWAENILGQWSHPAFPAIPLVIDGEEITQSPAEGKGVNPSNPGETFYTYSLATWEQIDRSIAAAKSAERSWGATPLEERCQLLSRIATTFQAARSTLCGVMICDGGKTLLEADPEVSEAIDFASYYQHSLRELCSHKDVAWKPKGTVLVTPPWNFPISIPAGGILAALATGNCVIFKPAPESVLCGWVLVNLLWEAGVPKNVLQFVNCPDEPVGSKLITDHRISSIILTGATSTARLFKRLNPKVDLYAETGGKNAMIITAMADRDLAIKDLVQSAFGHAGQKCSAASLAIVEAEVYDDPHFQRQLKDAVESLAVGPATQIFTKISPLIRPPGPQLQRGLTHLEPGEEWLVKPQQDTHNPCLWSPGVKMGVTMGNFTHQTELFGPVLGIMRAHNLAQAIEMANGTPYGLTGGLHSVDEREQSYFIRHIQVGNAYVNRTITGAIVERQPFGGCKGSSFGTGAKAGGPNYLTQFMKPSQQSLTMHLSEIQDVFTPFLSIADKAHFTPTEQATWIASLKSYSFWLRHFRQDFDPTRVLGQDNLFRYLPFHGMCHRVQSSDHAVDVLRIWAAAQSTRCPLEVSYTPGYTPFPFSIEEWAPWMNSIRFVQETEQAFFQRVAQGKIPRIRITSEQREGLWEAIAQSGATAVKQPVLANGRFELLCYLREMSISMDYHRYGNLGTREGERRQPVL